MKKIIFLFTIVSFILINFQVQSQPLKTLSPHQYQLELKPLQYEYFYTGQAFDTVSLATNDTIWSMQVLIRKSKAIYPNHQIKIAKVGSAALDVKILLLAKDFLSDNKYDTLSNVSYKGSVADTVIKHKLFTAKQSYNIYQQKVVLSTGKAKISSFNQCLRE